MQSFSNVPRIWKIFILPFVIILILVLTGVFGLFPTPFTIFQPSVHDVCGADLLGSGITVIVWLIIILGVFLLSFILNSDKKNVSRRIILIFLRELFILFFIFIFSSIFFRSLGFLNLYLTYLIFRICIWMFIRLRRRP